MNLSRHRRSQGGRGKTASPTHPQLKCHQQSWSPRGHILKSLDLVSKPQVLENCFVLGSRTGRLFFEPLKFCWKTPETSRKTLRRPFLFSSLGDRLKNNFEDLFFGEYLRLRLVLGLRLESSVLRMAVLGLALERSVLVCTSDHQ